MRTTPIGGNNDTALKIAQSCSIAHQADLLLEQRELLADAPARTGCEWKVGEWMRRRTVVLPSLGLEHCGIRTPYLPHHTARSPQGIALDALLPIVSTNPQRGRKRAHAWGLVCTAISGNRSRVFFSTSHLPPSNMSFFGILK